MEGVVYTGGDLARADHLLQGHQHQLDGQERHALVEEVQGAEEQQVPGGGTGRETGKRDWWRDVERGGA